MCFGMGCRWERSDGECTWHRGLPYPCSDLDDDTDEPEDIEDGSEEDD